MPELRDLLLTPEQAAELDAPGTKDAAVLVPLFRNPLTAVFTERRADLRRHAGEISFPGGRQDHPDEDLLAGHEMQRLLRKGVPIKTPTYTVDGHLVWGATARILQSLLERLAPIL